MKFAVTGLAAILAFSAMPVLAKPKLAPAAVAVPVEDQAAALRDDALKSNVAYDFLSELTTRFGPRPAGSEREKQAAEWSADEVYVALPRPGGDAWLRVALEDGQVEYEKTDRGWISYFNDLHKGRNTGAAWSWFIDIFAAACLVFSITGLFLLQLHARTRPSTWPVVGLGVLLPFLLALLFVHR